MRVLLAEDDPMIGSAVVQALRDEAYTVEWVADGKQALAVATREPFDLMLLDIGLPEQDGLAVLKSLRSYRIDVPVLIISARDAWQSCVEGLDTGADDYLSKPFAVSEMLARMRALLRRRYGGTTPEMSNGILTLNLVTRQVKVGGCDHALSHREFALLRALLARPGALLSRAALEDRIYGPSTEIESNVVEYIIHGLRQKLGPTVIKNVRGLGWMVERST